MARTLTRRRLLGTSALSAIAAAGATLVLDGSTSHLTKKSPTARVAPRPETSSSTCATQVFWRTEPSARLIALTFDDGPDVRWTPQAMTALAAYDAHATFFQLGDAVESEPSLSREVHAAGHEVASHGTGHLDLTDLGADAIRDNLHRAHDAIADVTGAAPTLVRPPWGRIDAPGLLVASELGYRVALWSHHLPTAKAEECVDHDVATASPGMIVLCHDGRSTPADTLYVAVRRMLAELTDDGYTFVTVSELLAAQRASSPTVSADPGLAG